jgi:L-lysine 2,3-aminomutase
MEKPNEYLDPFYLDQLDSREYEQHVLNQETFQYNETKKKKRGEELNEENKYSVKTIVNTFNSKKRFNKIDSNRETEVNEIDKKVVSKFKKLKKKRMNLKEETNSEIKKSKKLIPIGTNEYYNDLKIPKGQLRDAQNKKILMKSPLISGIIEELL